MMKPEKAIRYINAYLAVNKDLDDEEKEAFKTAFEALEKQIPKKPEKSDHWRLCPNCYEKYGFSYDYLVGMKQRGHEDISYCLGCGQAIDWKEGE